MQEEIDRSGWPLWRRIAFEAVIIFCSIITAGAIIICFRYVLAKYDGGVVSTLKSDIVQKWVYGMYFALIFLGGMLIKKLYVCVFKYLGLIHG